MTTTLDVATDLLGIRAVGPWLHDLAAAPDALVAESEAASFTARCELALQEILANIVTHGHPDGVAPAPIRLLADWDDGALRVVVVDRGVPYDPTEIAEPDPDAPQVHGYGLMIVRQLTRRFEHLRVDDTNQTVLEFAVD